MLREYTLGWVKRSGSGEWVRVIEEMISNVVASGVVC